MPFDAEEVVRRRAHRDDPTRLAHQRLHRQMVEQVLERTGEGCSIYGACKHNDISGIDAFDDRSSVIAIGVRRATVGERDTHIGKVEEIDFQRGLDRLRRGSHRIERLQQSPRLRNTPEDRNQFDHVYSAITREALWRVA
jgi:hypothetical protein